MKVYQAIGAVQAEISTTGIAKVRRNTQQGYDFRGIDDVFNALAPLLAKHKLCILPRILSREMTERTNAKGTALFYVTVEAEFDLVSAEDASKVTVRSYGEAMDSGDKATNKAMSAAYKYAALMTFAIPTEADNDPDAAAHEVQAAAEHGEALKMVEMLRGAAMGGSDALQKAFEEIPKSPLKARIWRDNSKALKEVAATADEVPA